MEKEVICPWCATAMTCRIMNYLSGQKKAWYECGKCGARSPLVELFSDAKIESLQDAKRAAKTAALKNRKRRKHNGALIDRDKAAKEVEWMMRNILASGIPPTDIELLVRHIKSIPAVDETVNGE